MSKKFHDFGSYNYSNHVSVQTDLDDSELTQAQSDMRDAISKHIRKLTDDEFEKLFLSNPKRKKMSGPYPIKIESVALNHKGGTKSYHATLLKNSGGYSLVILRWGKTGSFGQVKVEMFNWVAEASELFEKKISEKLGKGYEVDSRHDPASKEVVCFDELRRALGRPTMSKLGPQHLKHLDASADITGVKQPDEPHLDEDGKFDPQYEAKKQRALEEQMRLAKEELKRKQATEFEAAYKDNPNFGAF